MRNPACGQDPKPTDCYSENRATLHLHGGITPWISDGTPHQWTTPDGEATDYPQGVSVSNVPDMADPGPGALTFFYTNQQSARLMFYHDHAWGITRLNVYAGEAAGYLLTDDMEQSLIAPGGALAGLGLGTPLVVQDKTFVPSADKLAQQDPTWDSAKWGGLGNLWTPHVYMPAQNPGDPSGMSGFGRWMYGPWFWPPAKDAKYPPIENPYYDPNCDPDVQPFCEPALIPSTPNVSVGMEAFNDTPIVNGTAYPKTTVDPKAYRYRILNAANDRFWNLSWYVADPRTGTLSEVALKQSELDAAQTDPVVTPTPDETFSPKGPAWIQIGTEGGFLPTPVVVPAQPTTWITDPTRFDVGNVDQHSLLLAPAERADVIVDFSQFKGKTLILYNDAPAAFPARVPGYDYYTGGPDLSPAGAPTTLPGYGPNTRTIMKVTVSNATPEAAFDRPNRTDDRMGALVAAFQHHVDPVTQEPAGVFESGSDPIIVGQAAYNEAYGTNFAGSGWCSNPKGPTAKCDGYARIAEGAQPTDLFKFDTLAGPQLQLPFQPKGIHDEMNSANFDEWGRMTANIGLEAPGATPLLQNIILYPYVNPPTENLDASGMPSSLDVTPISSAADGTQLWKITHNGVDTHPIHFHLYDVQVVNRVTWDNIIIPPEPTELGWKDTVRVSPLEDTIVALRPIVPVLPFAVPDSKRPLNPMMPIGARGDLNTAGLEAGFNNTDTNGAPMTTAIVNDVVNFGWEYVVHCHILSHEEMDMMRPVTVHVPWDAPPAPTGLTLHTGQCHPQLDRRNTGELPRPDDVERLEPGDRVPHRTGTGRRSERGRLHDGGDRSGELDHVHLRPIGPDDHVRLSGHRLQRGRSGFVERGQGRRTAGKPDRAERRGGTRCHADGGWQGRPRLDERVAHRDERRSRARRRRRPVQPGGHRDPSGRRPGDLHRHFGDGRRRLQLPGQGGQRHRSVGVLQRRHGDDSARSVVDRRGQQPEPIDRRTERDVHRHGQFGAGVGDSGWIRRVLRRGSEPRYRNDGCRCRQHLDVRTGCRRPRHHGSIRWRCDLRHLDEPDV